MQMKVIKNLAIIAIMELIIAIPLVVGVYAWGMLAFPPDTKANECTVYGTFDADTFVGLEDKKYYHFKSYDNEVWWCFATDDIDFTPKANVTYALTFDNKGTTKEDPCPYNAHPEEGWQCDCHTFDDEFVSIEEVS